MSDERRVGVLGATWIASIVLYALIRTLVVWPTLGDYGVNPWVFLLVDVGSAWPFAYGQIRLVRAARAAHWRSAQRWSVATLLAFVAPYGYIAGAGSRSIPWIAWVVVGAFMAFIAALTLVRVRRRIQGSPIDGALAQAPSGADPSQSAESVERGGRAR